MKEQPITTAMPSCTEKPKLGRAKLWTEARELIWLLEHPALYSAGTSAKAADLVDPARFDVFESGRGGQYTYHGPGQRVAYVMLDLKTRGRDVSCFVSGLEQVLIDTLAALGVEAGRREGRIGVWVTREDGREEKIAAIGVRLKKWVSFHGIAINVCRRHRALRNFPARRGEPVLAW